MLESQGEATIDFNSSPVWFTRNLLMLRCKQYNNILIKYLACKRLLIIITWLPSGLNPGRKNELATLEFMWLLWNDGVFIDKLDPLVNRMQEYSSLSSRLDLGMRNIWEFLYAMTPGIIVMQFGPRCDHYFTFVNPLLFRMQVVRAYCKKFEISYRIHFYM